MNSAQKKIYLSGSVFYERDGMKEAQMQKFIMLDLDGVLFLNDGHFDPLCLANLKSVVDATGAKIVLSSDWRRQALDQAATGLATVGLTIHGCTPIMPNKTRYREIKTWLENNVKGKSVIAIVDDQPGAFPPGASFDHKNVYWTKPWLGLTDQLRDRMIAHLGVREE